MPSDPGRAGGRRTELYDVLLEADEPLTVDDLAHRLNVHANTVRFHLSGLVDDGRVDVLTAARSVPGRPARRYRARPGMDPGGPRAYEFLAGVLAAALARDVDGADRARAAGRSWGAQLAATRSAAARSTADRLEELLAGAGFRPRRVPGADEVCLEARHCPFLELATERGDIVCAIHLGMMEGALARWGEGGADVELQPFARPGACLVRLRADAPATREARPE